jgi:hypothetical protein
MTLWDFKTFINLFYTTNVLEADKKILAGPLGGTIYD